MSNEPAAPTDNRLTLLGGAHRGHHDPAVVGAKAANLLRMADAGLAVPPGMVLGTAVCAAYHDHGGRLEDELATLLGRGVGHIERATGLRFGAERRPLLVAVRSGAAVSMPGMLDTILNVGLCDATLPGLVLATGDPVFAWDSYRRLIQTYADVVEGCPPATLTAEVDDAVRRHGVPVVGELDVAGLRDLVARLLDRFASIVGRPFPQDPGSQLLGAVAAVLRSWNGPRAVEYRRLEGITDLAGTAVTIQAMVFGNLGVTSGSGVGFTRDPSTGENRLYLDFALDAQGEDIVGGRQGADDSEPLIDAISGLRPQLHATRRTLEATFADAQDFEFTVEEGRLWLLQTRPAKRTPWAALQIACDLVDEGLTEPATALDRLRPYDLDRITRVRIEPGVDVHPIGHGTPASAGVASGHLAVDGDRARQRADAGEPVILVRDQASTDDIAALAVCRGLLTAGGARTSHAAVVARQLGLVCVVNCPELSIEPDCRRIRIGDRRLDEGDTITIDGSSGAIYAGALHVVEERPTELIDRVRAWQANRPG